jgi:PAS fold
MNPGPGLSVGHRGGRTMPGRDRLPVQPAPELFFLAGPGEMAERTRSFDWASTPLGPATGWPQSLKIAVSICLGSRHPIVIWWGKEYIQFYNDAYVPFLGTAKHPGYLGRSGRECWSEIWPTIGPMLEGVYASGQATWSEDLLLVLHRNLPREEGYFTFSYSPILDESGTIGGIFCACNETTGRVISGCELFATWAEGRWRQRQPLAHARWPHVLLRTTLATFRSHSSTCWTLTQAMQG